jgi:phosphatidylinositol alpha 1,6-mannosyltransferase
VRESFTGAAVGTLIVGYVGRLAPEKRVEALAPVSRLFGGSMVVVGDGPRRRRLQRMMPQARFLGLGRGEGLPRIMASLARIMASLDLLVHPGPDETFCQVVQEAPGQPPRRSRGRRDQRRARRPPPVPA